jgi:glycosyltransferase involved in cell wall biosynthesis
VNMVCNSTYHTGDTRGSNDRSPERTQHPSAHNPMDSVQTAESGASLPPVSVIMAVYNGERYITDAIESVLGQTHQDFEFVIVNDGSTDRTQAIIDEYSARDERIRTIAQENSDQPTSLNRALVAATNDWVAVLDADDVCMPHRLETQLQALQRQPSVRVLGSYSFWIDQAGRKRGVRTLGPTSVPEFKKLVEQGRLITIVHPTVMMHRPTILALGGYDAEFGAAADLELWSRVSDEHVVLSLSKPLLCYRVHPGSMSANRFFEQQLMVRWIRARQHARRQGLTPPTLGEYVSSQGSKFTLRQLKYLRIDWVEYLKMRKRVESWRGHRLRALLIRVVGIPLAPSLFLRRH